jgi:hypothetical protein
MLEALLLTALLADPGDADACSPAVRALLDRPAAVLASGRTAATKMLGEPYLESVEVLHSARDEGRLQVRFRLHFDDGRAVFRQSAAGGAERLEELALTVATPDLRLPFEFGADEARLRRSLGAPARVEDPNADERRLVYECAAGLEDSTLTLTLSGGQLSLVEWRLAEP